MRGMWRCGVFAIALSAGFWSSVAAQSENACSMCERSLALDDAQWQCLRSQIDYYIKRPVEPFRISTVGCGGNRRTDPDPDSRVHITDKKAPIPPRPLVLSRRQTACLRDYIDGLATKGDKPPRPVDLVKLCGTPSIGGPR